MKKYEALAGFLRLLMEDPNLYQNIRSVEYKGETLTKADLWSLALDLDEPAFVQVPPDFDKKVLSCKTAEALEKYLKTLK